MRKTMCILLCLALLMGILGACGSTEASTGSTPAEESVSSSSEAAAEQEAASAGAEDAADPQASVLETSEFETSELEASVEAAEPAHVLPLIDEDITFTMFTGMNPNLMNYIDTYAETAIIRWLTETTGIKVEIPAIHPASEAEQWTLMAASGDFADFMCSIGNYPGGAQGALDDGIIYDLNGFEEQMPYFFAMLEAYPEVAKDCLLDSGALPATYRVISGDYYVMDYGPVIRSDWLAELNMEVPATYDEYYEVLKAFKTEYNATMWMSGSQSSILSLGYNIRCGYTFGMTSGLDCFYLEDGVVMCGFYTEAFKDFLTMMQQWMAEGLIDPNFATVSCDYVSSDGNAFSAVTNNKHGIWKEEANGFTTYDGYDMEFTAVPIARHNAGDIISVENGKTRVDGIQFAIATTCEHPELAAEWLDMWYSEEGTMVANWGLPGEGYELDENGEPHYTELITNNPDGLAMSFARELYAAPTGGYMYDRSTIYSLWNEQQLSAAELWCQNVDNSMAMPSFMARTTEESEEYAQISGDLVTYVSETLSQLMLGEKNLEADLDNFIATLKEMGMDRLIEIQQASYDRYLSR